MHFLFFFAAGQSAFADTNNVALRGDLLNGTFSVTVIFDTTTGDLVGSNFSVSDDDVSDTRSGLPENVDPRPSYIPASPFTGAGYEFLLALPTPTMAG